MELEKQVCSLELAQKMKELGVPQESYFSWIDYGTPFVDTDKAIRAITHTHTYEKHTYSAFTVAELGEMLPAVLKLGDTGKLRDYCCIEFQKYSTGDNRWGVMYTEDEETIAEHDGCLVEEYAITEADARAKMLIYLIENGLLDPKTLSV